MTRKVFLILLALALALSVGLVACGGGEQEEEEEEEEEPQYELTIDSTAGGAVTAPGEGTFYYDEGTEVDLVATADTGYQFVNWTGDVESIDDVNAASTTITMGGDYEITANFGVEILEIRDWYDLDAIRDNLGGTYVLMNDVDSTTTGYEEFASQTANEGKGWEPIGSILIDPLSRSASPVERFAGSLDGQGYEIRDLFTSRPDEDGVGLFGCVGEGVIQNLGIMGATVAGCSHVGSLVAAAFSDSTISDCYCIAGVSGYEWVGGLIGADDGAVSQCYSIGNVAGTQMVGGLMGGTWGSVTASYSNCDVTGGDWVGGLAGVNQHGTVRDSYFMGSVSSTGHVGGLVGWNYRGTVSSSYSTGRVSGGGPEGGLVGQNDGTVSDSFWDRETSDMQGSDGGTGKTTAEMKSIGTFSGAGWSIIAVADPSTRNPSYIWNIVDGQTYPFLSWQPVS